MRGAVPPSLQVFMVCCIIKHKDTFISILQRQTSLQLGLHGFEPGQSYVSTRLRASNGLNLVESIVSLEI
jgi:hypothetical protein